MRARPLIALLPGMCLAACKPAPDFATRYDAQENRLRQSVLSMEQEASGSVAQPTMPDNDAAPLPEGKCPNCP